MTPIFVYGTLKKSESRGSVLSEAAKIGDAYYKGLFSVAGVGLLDLNSFPGMIKNASSEESRVTGEVWLVATEVLEQLDMIEGHPDFFERTRVYAVDDGGQPIAAEAYLFSEEFDDIGSGLFSWNEGRLQVEELS